MSGAPGFRIGEMEPDCIICYQGVEVKCLSRPCVITLKARSPAITCQQLRDMQQGWVDGEEGNKICPRFIDACENLLDRLKTTNVPEDNMKTSILPRLYPVIDGSIDLDWPGLGLDCTLDMEDNVLRVTTMPPFPGKKPKDTERTELLRLSDIEVVDFDLPDPNASQDDLNKVVYETLMRYLDQIKDTL